MRILIATTSLLFSSCIVVDGSGTGTGIAGNWDGQLNCSEGSEDASMTLVHDSGSQYSGKAWVYAETMSEGYTTAAEMEVNLDFDLSGDGAQALDYAAELDVVRCWLYDGSSLVSDSCADIGISYVEGSISLGTMTWNGGDNIDMDDGDCSGTLFR